MKIVAFIAEFNPPHLGHSYFVDSIKQRFGEDTIIVAVMSGNYVQRGTPAICDVYARAEMALNIGVDLVLELPFPFSSSTAERFASAGISILDSLNCIDVVCFGSECGEIKPLKKIAEFLNSDTYIERLNNIRKAVPQSGYAHLREQIVVDVLGETYGCLLSKPNNILAVEYLRALSRLSSGMTPYTVQRIGDYHSLETSPSVFPSASMIREVISRQNIDLANYMGEKNALILKQETDKGAYSTELNGFSRICLAMLLAERRSPRKELPKECSADLYERFLNQAPNALDLNDLLARVRAKHETESAVKRALLHLILSVPANALDIPPAYTRVLAANEKGCSVLRAIRKKASIVILTKTADYKKIKTNCAKCQTELAIFADQVYNLCVMSPRKASDAVKHGPIIYK